MKQIRFFTLFISLMLSVASFAQSGAWNGKISVQGIELPLVFNFNSDGCTFDSPSQGVKGIPAEKTLAEDGTIKVEVKMIDAMFEGKMTGDSIKGSFTQNGFNFPLILVAGQMAVNRPQTQKPPFSYDEEKVTFSNDGYTFNGTLSLPKGYTDRTPVVLMVTGSGQQNRDEELFEHKPFAVIADALARNGIASLRYDDRGWNDSSVNFADFVTNDFKNDAAAALKLLRARFKKVGVLGHSEGGSIALLLASEGKTDFIVSLAGMAISGKETLMMQNRQALSSLGLTNDMVDAYCDALDKIFDDLASGKSLSELHTDNIPALLRPMFEKSLQAGDSKYVRSFIKVNPSQSLGKIKCPVLALNGTKDTQVDCVKNISALEKGLTKCPHVIKQLPDLNHLFQHCKTGNVVEYQQIEETISPEVLDVIVDWIGSLH